MEANELITEVLDLAPKTLTPQERLALVVFAAAAGADDRRIHTLLNHEAFQRRIGVASAKKVQELAQSLARKGALVSVARGRGGQRAQYMIAFTMPSTTGEGMRDRVEAAVASIMRPSRACTPGPGRDRDC